jgi:DNA-binding NtrC family response regulator
MNGKKILIVEDEPIVALDYRLFLERRGYRIITSFTGRDVLDNLNIYKPDLALLDIRLQDNISGIDIGKVLKEIGIPFIYISAFSDPNNLRKALELNPVHIFKKPVSVLAVYKAVEKIL